MTEDNDTAEDNMSDTKFQRFCDKWKINSNLITLKLTLFVLYGATSSLLPYLTIHMQSVGLTIEEIGMIYLAMPFTTFLAPPLTGFLVDKFGQYKPVVIISFLLNGIIHHSLLFIPHMEKPGVMPSAYVMTNPNSSEVEVWWSPCPSRECPEEEELDIVLDMCVDHCVLRRIQGSVIIPPSYASPANTRQHIDFNNKDVGDKDDLILHVEKKSKDSTKLSSKSGKRKGKKHETNDTNNAIVFIIDMHENLGEPVQVLGKDLEQDENDTFTDFKQRFGESVLWKAGVNITALEEEDLRCGGIVLKTNVTYEARLKEWSGDCMIQRCQFRDGGPDICPPDYMESDDKIFWIYFVLRFIGTILLSAGVTIMDPIALTMIEKYGGDFGRERLFSSLGMALFSPMTGFLIDMNSRRLGYTDYSAAFYTYDILLVISAVTVYLMPLSSKLPADDIFRNLLNILTMAPVVMFILFLFALGNLWGFIESFLFLYLKDLGAPNYLLGITVTVGTVSSMPFLYGAEKITKKIGHVNVIIIAFFAHAGRLVGYSFIENAWWCFPFEAMESLSVHLMWVAAATYCTLLAPKNLLATLIGVVGMSHFSIGRGSGSFFGGNLIGKVGIRESFRIMGLAAVMAGVLYSILNFFWFRKMKLPGLEKSDEEAAEEAEKMNNEPNEPKFKNASTMVSFERLSLVMEYNSIGSLTSLRRSSKSITNEHMLISRARSSSIRRGSYSIGLVKPHRSSTSASKVDLLKSANEVNDRNSNPQLKYSANNSITKLSQKSFTSITSMQGEDRMGKRDSILEEIEEIVDDKTKKDLPNNSTNINTSVEDTNTENK